MHPRAATVTAHRATVAVSCSVGVGLAQTRLAGPAEAPVHDVQTDDSVDLDRPWDVIVWDDPVNLMSYVIYVFRKVFGYPEPMARKLMLEVHQRGKALVASEPREQAEHYVEQLHGHGLQATMQRGS